MGQAISFYPARKLHEYVATCGYYCCTTEHTQVRSTTSGRQNETHTLSYVRSFESNIYNKLRIAIEQPSNCTIVEQSYISAVVSELASIGRSISRSVNQSVSQSVGHSPSSCNGAVEAVWWCGAGVGRGGRSYSRIE